PCPISVEATRMRAPDSVSSSDAFDASLTSPPPVNPEPWKKSASPIPRFEHASSRRRRRKSVRRTASLRTFRALVSRPSFWPVAAAVQQNVDVLGGQPAVLRDACLVADHAGMPLGRGEHVLDAVVHDLDGAAGLERQDRGMPRDHRGVFLLPAEPAARLRLDD